MHSRVETIDGSAVEGEDYQPVNEILTFEPLEREKEVGNITQPRVFLCQIIVLFRYNEVPIIL